MRTAILIETMPLPVKKAEFIVRDGFDTVCFGCFMAVATVEVTYQTIDGFITNEPYTPETDYFCQACATSYDNL